MNSLSWETLEFKIKFRFCSFVAVGLEEKNNKKIK